MKASPSSSVNTSIDETAGWSAEMGVSSVKFYLNAFPFGATRREYLNGVKLAGSDPKRFRRALDLLIETAQVADAGHMEGICFSEQHSNIEGIPEITTNPILFDALVAEHTTRIKVGQLGMTLSANHPIRVAEDLAMLDQMTRGRMFCGFTRGNATRWVSTLGRPFGTAPTESDKSQADERNMRAIREAWEIIKLAWTSDTFSYDGEFWTVPAENLRWGYPPTAAYGAGMREDGTLAEIGIVPRPYQQPYPRVFTPLAFRMTTARFWVGEGGTAVCYATKDDFLKTAFDVLSERAAEVGLPRVAGPLAPGAFLLLGKDQAEVDQLREDYDWLFNTAYSVPPFNVPMARMLVGTPDQVSRQIEDILEIAPFDEMFIWHNIGMHERSVEMSSLQLFVDKVAPRFQAAATPAAA
jgi:alkanesulfonate monooxygenase SsuD/methylene tetrahydromethanopterin reductase-like flavin-dependent oxidoreductase (luciferase family)